MAKLIDIGEIVLAYNESRLAASRGLDRRPPHIWKSSRELGRIWLQGYDDARGPAAARVRA